jgi:putative ABC transport system substrate-binding protein
LASVFAGTLAARAQQRDKLPTIGLMGSDTAAAQTEWTNAFVERLHELGWAEGRTVSIEYRWAEGNNARFSEIAAEFVRLGVDVIVTHNTPPTLAAKKATTVIPIVFATAGDPVGTGIVASLARPGGNITGLSSQGLDAAGKRLEVLRELVPDFQRLGTLSDLGNPFAGAEIAHVKETASSIGVKVDAFEIRRTDEIEPAFVAFKDRVQAVYVLAVPLVFTNRVRINALALDARLPTIHGAREYVVAGGLVSYGPNWPDMWRRAAELVGKILRGAKPADIPVEQPTKFDLVINLRTAKALGLTVPQSLLQRAGEVVE